MEEKETWEREKYVEMKKKEDSFRAKLLYNRDPLLDLLSFKTNTMPESYIWKLDLGKKP